MTRALISLSPLSLVAALALSGCSLSVGDDSSSQAQGQQTQASQASSDSAGSVENAQGSASTSASGTAASAGQAVAGYEPGQIPPIPMISLLDLSLLTQSTGAFIPDLTRPITSQPGITIKPARYDTSGSLVFGPTIPGGDGSITASSGTISVTNNDDDSGTYSNGKVSITVNGDGSGTCSDRKVSITVNGNGSGIYSNDYLSVTVNDDGSGTYSSSTIGESITLNGKDLGTYNRSGVSITNNGDGSSTYSDGKLSITNNGGNTAIVNGSTISAKPVPKAGKVGASPSIDAAEPVRSCGTVITLEDSVPFDFGSSKLHDETSTALTNLATVIEDSKAPKVQVQGRTDSVPDNAFNQRLPGQRAQTVSSALKSGSVAANLETADYSETKPVTPNEDPDGSDNPADRRLNCRIEVFVPVF